jgi:hypothetical protein
MCEWLGQLQHARHVLRPVLAVAPTTACATSALTWQILWITEDPVAQADTSGRKSYRYAAVRKGKELIWFFPGLSLSLCTTYHHTSSNTARWKELQCIHPHQISRCKDSEGRPSGDNYVHSASRSQHTNGSRHPHQAPVDQPTQAPALRALEHQPE